MYQQGAQQPFHEFSNLITAHKKTLLGMKRGLYETVRRRFVHALFPFSKGGRRCFRRHPQVAGREDYSPVGGTTRREQIVGCNEYGAVLSDIASDLTARI